jgi:hypothetical protein
MPAAGKDAKQFHQAVSSLINDPKLPDTFKQLDDDPKERASAKSDPKGYLKRKGHNIPDEAEVTFKEGSWNLTFCCWGYCITIQSQ